jgi:hypothetical protein
MAKVTSSPDQRRLGRRARLCLATALCALYPLVVAGTAVADDLGAVLDGSGQGATTGQEATTNGVATQSGPINVVVSVRLNSPGNDGPISQSNVTVVNVGARNDSTTSQSGAGELGGGQQAATGQDASATGEGTQSQPTNIVVSIRINSPGNDGPVSQTNVVAVGVSAGNASLTDQAVGSAGGEQTPKTAVPLAHALRHGAVPAEAGHATTAAHNSRRSALRRSALAPRRAEGTGAKSLERPISGAAAAQTAGLPAAAARASGAKPVGSRPAQSASSLRQAATSVLRHLERVPSVSPRAGQQDGGAGLLPLTAIALLGALLVWVSSRWLGGLSRPVRAAWGRRP